jgi:hypothetical protein
MQIPENWSLESIWYCKMTETAQNEELVEN